MARIPDDIRAFMAKHSVREDELWPVPGGKSFAIKHGALERIAALNKIAFHAPVIVEADAANGIATIRVDAAMGDESTWSFGEASPKNNKNAYPWAMAEKRAKDRCTLKLLQAHGAIYSEDEAEDFRQSNSPAKDPLATERMAYMTLALGIIRNFKTSAPDLKDWWMDEAEKRDQLCIVNGSSEYTELFKAFKDKGLSLASNSNVEGQAA